CKRNTLTAALLRRGGDGLGGGDLAQAFDLARLGYIPVLAELAAEVAAGGAEGEDAGAGVEVVERLFLDRVDTEPGTPAVGREDHLAALILAHEAEAAVACLHVACARAEVADDPARLRGVVPPAAGKHSVGPQFLFGRQSD